MNTDENRFLTEKIIGCAIRVSNKMGVGFLEKVYENALVYELKKARLNVERQCILKVYYDHVIVGEYCADVIVDSSVLLELKSARMIDPIHEAQLLNYLRASKLRVGLILNFGTPKLGVRRFIL